MGNRVRGQKRLWIAILAVALGAVLLTAACGPAPPLEQKQVVQIGLIVPLTGGAAAPSQYGFRNQVDYFRYAEEVGISGVTLPPGVTI